MQLLLRPVDVWLFRDGRPFTAGEEHFANTLFPPSPFTLQGAIRTKVLTEKGVNLVEFSRKKQPDQHVGFGDNFGELTLFGPLLAYCRNGNWERLLPMPADVVWLKGSKRYALLTPLETPPKMLPELPLQFKTNLPNNLHPLWTVTDEPFGEAKGWLRESAWQSYLDGKAPLEKQALKDDMLFTFEPRFGIAINRQRRTTETGLLYQVRFVRLKDEAALWLEVNGVNLPSQGMLRIGGEGKAAHYTKLDSPLPPIPLPSEVPEHFKVVLLTQAWFSDGWKPKDWRSIFGEQVEVELVAVALPRPQLFGGFDVAQNKPKPIRAFVPAGAVYFFRAKESFKLPEDFAFTETPESVRQQNDGANAWARIGLGKVLIGRW